MFLFASVSLTLLLDEPLRVPHGLGPLRRAGLLAHPNPDAAVAVVNDEGVLGLYVGLHQRAVLHLGDLEGAVLVGALVQLDVLAGPTIKEEKIDT